MNYPLISEYIEAIRAAEDNFDKLSHLRPVLDGQKNPVMSSGNFAVVFKMTDGKKCYALKCFLKEQGGRDKAYRMIAEELKKVSSPYLASINYYAKELFVNSRNCEETEFPVLLMDWVDGMPLDRYIKENSGNSEKLRMLAYRFSLLAQWLVKQPFAHGDLKPDNILVNKEGELVLVDYDGMFVPQMEGQKARELGSPDFRHPKRTEKEFDKHLDDFPLAVIALSLKAISLDTSLLSRRGSTDGLLLSEADYLDIAHSETLKEQTTLFYDEELSRLYALFLLAYTGQSISANFYELFAITEIEIKENKTDTPIAYATSWRKKSERGFTQEEKDAVINAKVVDSKFGKSVCFLMVGGGNRFIPVSKDSNLNLGDIVDLNKAKLIILSREGNIDIVRIE